MRSGRRFSTAWTYREPGLDDQSLQPRPHVRRVTSSLVKFADRTKGNDASLLPVVEMAVSVMFPGNETVYDGTIVGLLASQRGRRIALVRLAVENGPRQDDFRAPWFMTRPAVEEWGEVAQFPKSLQQACFPREGERGSSSVR